jgi:hypothetical protein
MRLEPGDKVTVRYTFTLPETEPPDGFKLPPTPLSQVNTVVVRERDAATRDDKPGTVRRMRDTGVLVVKRRSPDQIFTWCVLDVPQGKGRGAFTDAEVCGYSDYVGAVPGSEAETSTNTVRVWLDKDNQYWFELEPERLTWGGSTSNMDWAFDRACGRAAVEGPNALVSRAVESVASEFQGRWINRIVTKA